MQSSLDDISWTSSTFLIQYYYSFFVLSSPGILTSCFLIKKWYPLLGAFTPAFTHAFAPGYGPVFLRFLCRLIIYTLSIRSSWFLSRSSSYCCLSASEKSLYFFIFLPLFYIYAFLRYGSTCLGNSTTFWLFLIFLAYLCKKSVSFLLWWNNKLGCI